MNEKQPIPTEDETMPLTTEEEARLKAMTEKATELISDKQMKKGSAELLEAIQNGDAEDKESSDGQLDSE